MIMSKHISFSRCLLSFAKVAGVAGLVAGAYVAPLQAQTTTETTTTTTLGADTDPTPVMDESYSGYGSAERAMLKIAYSMAFPSGGLHDYAADASFRGFDLTLLWPVFKGLYVGAGFGFNGFYEEKPRETYHVNNSDITGKLYRYVDHWAFSAVAQWFFLKPDSIVRPYAGVRLGVAALSMTTLVVDLAYQDAPAGFLVVPEVGAQLKLSRQFKAYVSYQFNYSTASVEGATQDYSGLSFSSIQIGFALAMGGG
jgi:outer membrane protein